MAGNCMTHADIFKPLVEWEVIGPGPVTVENNYIGLTYSQARSEQDRQVAQWLKDHPGATKSFDGGREVGFFDVIMQHRGTEAIISINSYDSEDY